MTSAEAALEIIPGGGAKPVASTASSGHRYEMRISRMTVDKLGVRLYDRVSAVVAELVANGYDADAEKVVIRVPLATVLARRGRGGETLKSHDYVIEVVDNGHGMTPKEANDHFLRVGKDRRTDPKQGKRSKLKNRPVMGRKGIGKLAPFGICKRIEIISAGGEKTPEGYVVSHFVMDYDQILVDDDQPVPMEVGDKDGMYRPRTGTTVRLVDFLPKKVPNREIFHRQMARRFGIRQPDFSITVEDTRHPDDNPPFRVGTFDVELMDGTRVDVSRHPVKLAEDSSLPVSGWMGLAKKAYKNEEMAGVRIYARGKIVATTRDFGQPAGFTGEFTMRSYLVGEVHAEWLDDDEGEDLITTHRQDILWESDYGRALRVWGAERIKEMGAASRKPRRRRVANMFLQASALETKALDLFSDPEIVATAVDLGSKIGSLAAEDELSDQDYVDSLVKVVLSVAPHKALIDGFHAFNHALFDDDKRIVSLLDLFSKTRVAEMASYAQIADHRVRAIRELEQVVGEGANEAALQSIIASAPWLIEPTWAPVTINQSLKLFQRKLSQYCEKRHGQELVLTIDHSTTRPDFTLINVGKRIHIVEIKAVGHTFGNADYERLHNYLEAFDAFWEDSKELASAFPRGWIVDLVCDKVRMSDSVLKRAYEYWQDRGRVALIGWNDFLARAIQANEEFLDAQEHVRQRAEELGGAGSGQ